jgi:probable F420-dependent oxidoreductase
VVERDPITLAKEVASIDFISGGRFLFGVGGGWNVEEMENHGTDYGTRWTLMKERIEAMKEIWTKDDAEYHGKFVNFDAIWSFPKPVQKPHPPIFVGGDGERTLQRVVKYGDAWMPIPGRSNKPLGEKMKDLQELAAAAGRGPIPVTIYGALPRPEVINHFAEIGVDRCIFWLSPAQEAEVLPQLERYEQIAREVATAGA